MTQKNSPTTPLMQQYFAIKQEYPDTLLLFQVGDFYELFFDDAKKAAAFLGITLTTRGKNHGEDIPLCGVPIHARDHYIAKLVRGGFRVALCDQLEQPRPGQVVKRGVTNVLTPGTLTDGKLLDEKSASYLFSFFPTQDSLGLLFGELLTAQLFATVIPYDAVRLLEGELSRFFPDEILIPEGKEGKKFGQLFSNLGYCLTYNQFDEHNTEPFEWLNHFRESTVQSVQQHNALQLALYNMYWYLKKNQERALAQFSTIHFYDPEDFLVLDPATQRNLELVQNAQDGKRSNTLFSLLDKAVTPMGSRSIKKWLVRPLLKEDLIAQRHDIVAYFMSKPVLLQRIQGILRYIGDLERIIGRIALARASVYDYVLLGKALRSLPELKELLQNASHFPLINLVCGYADNFHALCSLLEASLHDAPEDGIIKKGFDQELDRLRNLAEHSNQAILELEQQEQARTGIASLKIRFNNLQGYYIEVTKPNMHLVPDDFIRSQSLVGKERFTTVALRKLEVDIMTARANVERVEQVVFERIKSDVAQHVGSLRKWCQLIAHLDALAGFAAVAAEYRYVRPTFNDQHILHIKEGRHPVIDAKLQHRFIPNDTQLDDTQKLLIITGPNMGGKSTFLRQTALISIMAHCGSFVPAKQANIPLLDRIFTRIGAGDNVADGKSTFLVEMEETTAICTYATKNSLIILDEVGRGTSTFDGLALAQAVIEYIYTTVQASCLFATHYHELTQLSQTFPGIVAYHAASKKTEQGILLLYKILLGAADGSFGLEVAKLAQIPPSIIARADTLLKTLTHEKSYPVIVDQQHLVLENQKLKETIHDLRVKLKEKDELWSRLNSINLNDLSPKKAFDMLWELKGD
ncbi:MAG: DNA mismatch repair protein MutS [Candidatus Babeliales bacterium]